MWDIPLYPSCDVQTSPLSIRHVQERLISDAVGPGAARDLSVGNTNKASLACH